MARPGYHKLTPDELQAHGLSPTSERYVRHGDVARYMRTRSAHGAEKASISRRQYDQQRYIDAGWRNRDDFERRFQPGHRNMAGYRRWREAAIAKGVATPDQIDRPNSTFNRLFIAARKDDFDRGGRRRGPRSAIARFLVYTGLRDEGADYPVGGS